VENLTSGLEKGAGFKVGAIAPPKTFREYAHPQRDPSMLSHFSLKFNGLCYSAFGKRHCER